MNGGVPVAVDFALGVGLFSAIVLLLVAIILLARSRLVASGNVHVTINGSREVTTPVGVRLLQALNDAGILVPSACAGGGSCGQCRLQVLSGGGAILPTETSLINSRDARNHYRLACQVAVKQDLEVRVPEEVLGVREYACRVASNRNVASFIKELVLQLPEDEEFRYRAGGYVQVACGPYSLSFEDFDIDERFRGEWDRLDLWKYRSNVESGTSRAYSMASFPLEEGIIRLNVRIATPPAGAPRDTPPGQVSSYIFGLKPGDPVTIAGPFGDFFARETDNEMVFIGGGAGMAPMRAHILDQLLRLGTERRLSFWYGARSLKETFYVEDFDALEQQFPNFSWHIALSEPQEADQWSGYTGFIHEVVLDNYLEQHPAPEDCEFYICGPPMMNAAVLEMLDQLGVPPNQVLLDDFG